MYKSKLLFFTAVLLISLGINAFMPGRTIGSGGPVVFKTFTVSQLQHDFKCLRDTLEAYHPRLYEFTPKKEMDRFLDSLYGEIKTDMNEIEFRYFLFQIIAKIHCSHTGIGSSDGFNKLFTEVYKCPPFKLYYADGRSFIRFNFSGNPALQSGTEIAAINGMPVSALLSSFFARVTLEGIHDYGVYYRINERSTTLFSGFRDYYKTDSYTLTLASPKKDIVVNAMSWNAYQKVLLTKWPDKQHELNVIDSATALLVFPVFQFAGDSLYEHYLPATFEKIKRLGIKNLVIDLRGNGGGPGFVAGSLLKHLLLKKFTYYREDNAGPGFEEYKQPTALSPNHFTGNLYCLMDAGCLSSSGHFLSMIKYHQRGTLIGGPSTAGFSCNGNGVPHVLPNTGLVLFCPFAQYDTAVEGFDRAKGIAPDIEVKTTLQDVIKERDPVLEYTLNLIRQKNNRE